MKTDVIILAAGRGSRMEDLTKSEPKCFIKFGGKRLIDYQLEKLDNLPVDKIYIVTGYLKDKFHEYQSEKIELIHNAEWEKTNMIWSLLKVEDKIKNQALILYSDIIYDKSNLLKLINAKHKNCLLADLDWEKQWAARFSNILDDAESFRYDKKNLLREIGTRVADKSKIMAQFCGMFKIDINFINALKKLHQINLKKADVTSSINELISCEFKMHVIKVYGGWFELDREHDLRVLENNHLNFLSE